MGVDKGERSPSIRSKALFGGPFGRSGRYAVATVPCIDRGLHGVKFMVLDPQAGHVLAVDTDKREALAAARRLLRAAAELECLDESGRPLQSTLWSTAELPVPADATAPPKRLTRRRREVFERSQGRCFYCRAPLQALGPWHIEHVVARALGGQDTPLNLQAACVKCNLAKRDRSGLEYLVQQVANDGE